jgi:hypothetical protein
MEGDFVQAGLSSGRQTLDVLMLERGRLVAESVMRVERAEIFGPEYFPSVPCSRLFPDTIIFLCAGIARSLPARETEQAQSASKRKAACNNHREPLSTFQRTY